MKSGLLLQSRLLAPLTKQWKVRMPLAIAAVLMVTGTDLLNGSARAQQQGCRFLLDDCGSQSTPPKTDETDVFFNGQPFFVTTYSMGTWQVVYGEDGVVTYRQTNCGSTCGFIQNRYLRTIDGVCETGAAPKNDPNKGKNCYILRKLNDHEWGLTLVGTQSVASVWRKP